MPKVKLTRKQLVTAICLALALVTLLVYLPMLGHGFVNYDDPDYITGNPHVKAGLTWPGSRGPRANRSELGAWNQALRLAVRRFRRPEPVILFSHVPPRDAGDSPIAGYHRGFSGYRWLMRRLRPPLWLHGHTPLASTTDWHIQRGATTLVNVTGAVVLEIWPPGAWSSPTIRPEEAAQN